MTIAAIVAGLVLLYLGGEALVRGSVAVAVSLGLSPLFIGITLVGFGTSVPELVTSLDAALIGAPGIAVGNVVGSNLANILLILGLAAVIAPVACAPRAFRRDVLAVAASGIVVVVLAWLGNIGLVAGMLLIAALLAYLAVAYVQEHSAATAAAAYFKQSADVPPIARGGVWRNLAIAVLGIAIVVAGAHILVDGAIDLARTLGVPDTIVGLTVVAVGTSLPELAATVAAARRREGDVALGNVLGSCVFNVFGILGVTAVVRPLAVPPGIFRFDAWVLLAVSLLLVVFAVTGRRLSRGEGVTLLALYAAYIGYLVAGVVR